MTNRELNVMAAELLGRTWKGAILHMHPECVYYVVEAENEDGEVESSDWCFSPATSIEDAMGLRHYLPDDTSITLIMCRDTVELNLEHDGPFLGKMTPRQCELPRAITEAFIAAMEASG